MSAAVDRLVVRQPCRGPTGPQCWFCIGSSVVTKLCCKVGGQTNAPGGLGMDLGHMQSRLQHEFCIRRLAALLNAAYSVLAGVGCQFATRLVVLSAASIRAWFVACCVWVCGLLDGQPTCLRLQLSSPAEQPLMLGSSGVWPWRPAC